MRRILLLFFLSLASVAALAAVPKTLMWDPGYGLGFKSTPSAACSALVAHLNSVSPNVVRTVVGLRMDSATTATCPLTVCIPERSDLPCSSGSVTVYASQQCPESSSLVGKECVCTSPAIEQGGQCNLPTQCVSGSGDVSTINVTLGWARSPLPNKADHIGAIRNPSSICAPGKSQGSSCRYVILDNSNQFRSQTPSEQGLYRISGDFTVIQSDRPCSPADDGESANPDTPDLKCPGSVGQLNGKPICAIDPGTSGVEPVGSPGVGGALDDKGNPTAGKKPDSGEGSGEGGVGRTPSTGNGGNRGGPGSAANGGTGTKPGTAGPDGTTTKPGEGKEQAACGAPGQPKCAVKVDETGTPEGKDAFQKAKGVLEQVNADFESGLESIKSTSDKDTSWGVIPSWIAHADCRPWDLGAFEIMRQSFAIVISICDVMPYVVATTSFLWIVGTFFLTIGMVFRVTSASQG